MKKGRLKKTIKTAEYIVTHPEEVFRLVYACKIQYPSLYTRLTDFGVRKKTLDQIGMAQKTDKASAMLKDSEFDSAHDYLRQYDIFFSEIRDKEIKLLEFGCQGGNSLRTWEEYFSKADIFGVDLDEYCRKFETKRTHIVVGNAVSDETYNSLNDKGTFDIIIDDASHAWGEQRYCLEKYWDMLNPGGYYVVEDLGCGCYGEYYNKGYIPSIIDRTPFFDYARDLSSALKWQTYDQFLECINDEQRPTEFTNIQKSLDSMFFAYNVIIFRKKS